MESQGGSKRSADQLQGVALQDQAVRSDAAGSRVLVEEDGASAEEQEYRVIVRYADHVVRGLAEVHGLGSIEDLLQTAGQRARDTIRLKRLDTDAVEDVPTKGAKAVFIVRSFDGNERHNALHFHHESAPIASGLWVRVTFYDNEVIEGFIGNTRDFVLEDGFFLLPTDPDGNNLLVYVPKSGLKDFHVLGIRKLPKNLMAR